MNDQKTLLDDLRRVADEIDETPTQRDVQERGEYSPDAYIEEFGSFVIALEEAGLEPSIEQYQGSDLTPPEDKRWTKNVRALKRNGPTKLSELPSSPTPRDKEYGLWKFSVDPGRDGGHQPDIPNPETFCYLEGDHDPETVLREFFAEHPRLLDHYSKRTLVSSVRNHRKEWEEIAERVVPKLRAEREAAASDDGDEGLLLVDCSSNDVWTNCAERTVASTVSVDDHLPEIGGERYVWGFPEEYEPAWSAVEPGDVVAFATESSRCTLALRVDERVRDWNAGMELWAEYDDGLRIAGPDEPWPYLLLGTDATGVAVSIGDIEEELDVTVEPEPVQYIEQLALDEESLWTYLLESGEPDSSGTVNADGSSTGRVSGDRETDDGGQTDGPPAQELGSYTLDARLAAVAAEHELPLSEIVRDAVSDHLKRAIDGDLGSISRPTEPTVDVRIDLDDRQRRFLETACTDLDGCERPDDIVNDALRARLDVPEPGDGDTVEVEISGATAAAARSILGGEGEPVSEIVESALIERIVNRHSFSAETDLDT